MFDVEASFTRTHQLVDNVRCQMQRVRPPAIAGHFYPAEASVLQAQITQLLAAVPAARGRRHGNMIIVPHAGYEYSGQIAARAYAAISGNMNRIKKVLLIGPAHRKYITGVATSSFDVFATPLGHVELAYTDREFLIQQGLAKIDDEAHECEHALEVQLPFIQCLCENARLIPLVVGDASIAAVRAVLNPFWSDAEVLIVVSSDLSHFQNYTAAQRLDAATIDHITSEYELAQLDAAQACGYRVLNGALSIARERSQRVRLLAAANSADAGASRERVVGYASFVLDQART